MEGVSFGMVAAFSVCTGAAVYYTVDAVARHWRQAKTAEFAATLKQQMIEKGFTADEIVRVLAAEADAPSATAGTTNLAALLIDGGYDAEAVADITAAVDAAPAGLRDTLRAAVGKMVENGYDGDDIHTFIARRVESAGAATA